MSTASAILCLIGQIVGGLAGLALVVLLPGKLPEPAGLLYGLAGLLYIAAGVTWLAARLSRRRPA